MSEKHTRKYSSTQGHHTVDALASRTEIVVLSGKAAVLCAKVCHAGGMRMNLAKKKWKEEGTWFYDLTYYQETSC